MMMRRLQLGALRRVVLLMMLVAACPAQSSSVPTSPFASTAKIAKLAKPKPAIKKIRIGIEPQKHSVALVALGCPKNTVDAEVMLVSAAMVSPSASLSELAWQSMVAANVVGRLPVRLDAACA